MCKDLIGKVLTLLQKLGRQDRIGHVKHGLAILNEQQANFSDALVFAQEALEIYERLGMKKAIEELRELVERLEGKIAEARK